jgi:hypothetical protein
MDIGTVAEIEGGLGYMTVTYGGFTYKIEGKALNIKNIRRFDAESATFDAEVKVTLSDDFTFAPKGTFNYRLLIPSYNAAHLLQTKFGFPRFNHTLSFTEKYDNIIAEPR